MNLLSRIHNYLNALPILLEWTVTGYVVDPELAQKRADVCTGRLSGFPCPMNKADWKLTEKIAAAFKQQVELKNHLNLRVTGEKQLHTCSGCGCPLRTKIWMELKTILPDETERKNFAVNCWLLTETPPNPKTT